MADPPHPGPQSGRLGRLLAVLVSMLIGLPAACWALDPSRSMHQFQRQIFQPRPGEPRAITAVAQTPDGYLWIGTITGLYRFDGFDFELMTELGGQSISGRPISFMQADAEGALWIGYYGAGAGLWRGGVYTPLPIERGWNIVSALAGTPDAELWAVINRRLVRVRHLEPEPIATEESVGAGAVREVLVDAAGTVWVAMAAGDDLRYRLKGERHFRSVGRHFGAPSLSLADGAVLAAGANGLFAIALDGGLPKVKQLSKRFYWQVLVERSGAVLAAGRDGLRRVPSIQALLAGPDDLLDGARPLELSSPNHTETAVWQLLEDAGGNVWAATGAALERFRDSPMVPVRVPGTAYAYGVVAAEDGHIWMANWTSGLLKVRAGTEPVRFPGAGPSISALWRAPDGLLWVGGPSGLWEVDAAGRAREVHIPEELLKPWVAGLAGGDRKELWVLSSDLTQGDPQRGNWRAGAGISASPGHQLRTMAPDGQGGLWVGFGTQVARLSYGRESGGNVPRWEGGVGAVQALAVSSSRLWVGGLDGLALGTNTTAFATRGASGSGRAGGAPDSTGTVRLQALRFLGEPAFQQVVDVLETSAGDLWVRGTVGAWRVKKQQLDEALQRRDGTIAGEYFDAWDGLDGVALVSKSKLAESSDGLIWFGTSQGAAWFDPKQSLIAGKLAAPMIRDARVDAASASLQGGELVMSSAARHLELRYTAVTLTHPERIRFRYMLDGFESSWQDAGTRRSAFYNDLPPGAYKFRLATVDARGRWSDGDERVLAITVKPQWFQTWAFKAGTAAAVLVLLMTGWRLQARRAERTWQAQALARETAHNRVTAARQAERNRIARELHDTLLQGVFALIWKLQAVAERLPVTDPVRKSIDAALSSAERALEKGREQVQELRAGGTDHLALLDELEGLALQECEGVGIGCMVSSDGDVRPIASHLHAEVLAIAAEAVRNACRHAGAKRVELVLAYRPTHLSLTVSDDGAGITDAAMVASPPGHWGLVGMRERAMQIGATFSVRRLRSKGTQVEVTIPTPFADIPLP